MEVIIISIIALVIAFVALFIAIKAREETRTVRTLPKEYFYEKEGVVCLKSEYKGLVSHGFIIAEKAQ